MKFSTTNILVAALLLAAGTQQAYAQAAHGNTASTNTAGATIVNTAKATYTINGVEQTVPAEGHVDITVDRKVDLTVTGGNTTNVAPGDLAKGLKFEVTNNTNDTMDFALSVANGGPADEFDIGGTALGNVKYYKDDGAGAPDLGQEIVGGNIDDLASNGTLIVWVVLDMPNDGSMATGDAANVVLTATAKLSDGTALTATNADDDVTGTIYSVWADVAGETDADKDRKHSAYSTYEVTSADITVAKSSFVLWDPINEFTSPKAIPGAVVIYCVTVKNVGAVDVTDVKITDDLSTSGTSFIDGTNSGLLTVINDATSAGNGNFSANQTIIVNVGAAAPTCDADAIKAATGTPLTNSNADTDGAKYTGTTVEADVADADIAAPVLPATESDSTTMIFTATID